jgi:hypothetical protein
LAKCCPKSFSYNDIDGILLDDSPILPNPISKPVLNRNFEKILDVTSGDGKVTVLCDDTAQDRRTHVLMALGYMPGYERFISWYTDVMCWISWESSLRVYEHSDIISESQSYAYIIAAADARWEADTVQNCKPKVLSSIIMTAK